MKKEKVPKKIQTLTKTLQALANNNRLLIIHYLTKYEYASVGAISDAIQASLHNTSKHLAILERANIVTYREDGVYRFYSLHPKQSSGVLAIIRQLKK